MPEVLNMRLYEGKRVLVVWKWTYDFTLPSENDESCIVEESDKEDDSISADSNSEDNATANSVNISTREHTVVFKCIGATRDKVWQQSLQAARDKREQGEIVPVRLRPEPNNIRDSKAIAFDCCLDGKWMCIGYVVRELLDEVHDTMNKGLIVHIEFDWIKYKSNWTYSGPGYFTGIAITKRGCWSDRVIASSSA